MFYYYGGKKSLVKYYHLPKYSTIIEPFAGSAAYTVYHLKNGNINKAILVEKDPRVFALWHRLMNMTVEELQSIKIPSIGSKTSDFLFMTAATGNAVAKCRNMSITPRMPRIIKIMLKSMESTLPLLQGKIEIRSGDYSSLSNIEATWFIDPPYQIRNEYSKTIYSKGMGYSKTCSSDSIDFYTLGKWCRSRKGQVIVCEQMGANWLPFVPLADMYNSLGLKKQEVFWTNEN